MAIRRQVKNVVKNFTDIEVKVREATSNDPWGPSSSLTSEIADATYNNQAFNEIMVLLWKRINDHGKNWRHVYKSLVVLEYIVKTGSERVAQQCKEHIFAIKTLKDFQFIDKDGKDQGVNVREKSKALVALLKDEERLKNERQRALKAKERFSQSQGGIGNTSFPKNRRFQGTTKYPETRESQDDSYLPPPSRPDNDRNADSRSTDGRIDSEIEKVRPSNEVEEEMQLQIALAMSREEAEKDERTQNVENELFGNNTNIPAQPQQQTSTLLNLTDLTIAGPSSNNLDPLRYGGPEAKDPWVLPPQPVQQVTQPDPWETNRSASVVNTQPQLDQSDPWGTSQPASQLSIKTAYPSSTGNQQPSSDPWSNKPVPQHPNPPSIELFQQTSDPFAPQDNKVPMPSNNGAPLQPQSNLLDPIDMFGDTSTNQSAITNPAAGSSTSFLANGSHLVDVDNIMAKPDNKSTAVNPFMTTSNTNPFAQDKPKPKSINELRNTSSGFAQPNGSSGVLLPTPLQPSQNNPFL